VVCFRGNRSRPTVELMQSYAKKYNMVIIVPVYEKEQPGILYNTAAVIDADGTYLGKYRKNHIPHTSGFWRNSFLNPGISVILFFKPGMLRSPCTLLRPSFSRWRENSRFERRGNSLQSVRNRGGFISIPLEIGTTRARCG